MVSHPERRELTFNSLDEVVAEAERLAAAPFRTSGEHSFGQILNHLAISQDASSGRLITPPPPFFMRLMRPLIRRMAIHAKPLKPGIKLPAKNEAFFWPNQEFDLQAALQYLKESTKNYQQVGPLAFHPFFGKLSKLESDQLNCRHAALHLSFVHTV